MPHDRSTAWLPGLVRELCALPDETPWVEFKVDNSNPHEIGEYVSALSNAAALAGKNTAYLLWGVTDADHALVGTTFDPARERRGNEELESWLLRSLSPRINFHFHIVEVDGARVVLMAIDRAAVRPVAFFEVEYIRIGTYKKKLKDFPEKERELWRLFERVPFEDGVAAEHLDRDTVLQRLDHASYFELLDDPPVSDPKRILERLVDERLVRSEDDGSWSITNLGALLFARDLDKFERLSRKMPRVIQYVGSNRMETRREQMSRRGYAVGFQALMETVLGLLPANEHIGAALRRQTPLFPPLAVRELIANALIHQDLTVTGAGPMIELFDDRIEITNPGEPLVSARRLVDAPPRSRNERLASLLRRMGICEERGSGWDKIALQAELYQLPAPLTETANGATRVTLFAPRSLARMDKVDRVRSVYLHACLQYVGRGRVTNASVRKRFEIDAKNSASASRLITEALEAGEIVPFDPTASKRNMQYVPSWAAQAPDGP